MHSIPSILQFVWLGGCIPQKQAELVAGWRKANPGYKVKVWYDKSLLPSDELAEFFLWAKKNEVELVDVGDVGLKNIHTEYECRGPYVNYGAASDIYRLMILEKEGGIYLDTDILETEMSLPIPFLSKHGFLIDHEVEPGIYFINNDIIACTPNHPIVIILKKELLNRYNNDPQNISLSKIRDITIDKSGPNFIRRTLYEKCKLGKLLKKGSYQSLELDKSYAIDRRYFKMMKGSDQSWLTSTRELPRKKYNIDDEMSTHGQFVTDVIMKSFYEAKYNKFLNLGKFLIKNRENNFNIFRDQYEKVCKELSMQIKHENIRGVVLEVDEEIAPELNDILLNNLGVYCSEINISFKVNIVKNRASAIINLINQNQLKKLNIAAEVDINAFDNICKALASNQSVESLQIFCKSEEEIKFLWNALQTNNTIINIHCNLPLSNEIHMLIVKKTTQNLIAKFRGSESFFDKNTINKNLIKKIYNHFDKDDYLKKFYFLEEVYKQIKNQFPTSSSSNLLSRFVKSNEEILLHGLKSYLDEIYEVIKNSNGKEDKFLLELISSSNLAVSMKKHFNQSYEARSRSEKSTDFNNSE